MDLGRDVITKAITSTEAEKVFQPWWVTVQHYLVYSLVVLGLIALPINCMLGTIGNCEYDTTHTDNYALPFKVCRVQDQQLIIEDHVINSTIRDINSSLDVTQVYMQGDLFYVNVTHVPQIFQSMTSTEYIRMHLQKNARGCYVKKSPKLFPFFLYWTCVNQLSLLVLYFPYMIFGLALTMVLLERLLTRFFWTAQRIEKFYNLLVKEAIKDGVSWNSLHTRENRLACQQVLFDFRESSIYYRAYMCQTLGKLTIAVIVISWSFAKQCNQLRMSYKTNLHSRVQGYMHQCSIPANGMNLVIFDIVNGVLLMIFLSSSFTLLWYIRILLPYHCYGMFVNTKLSRILNRCKEEMKPFPAIIDSIYFKSLDMRLLLNILTETKGLRASLTILSLFDVQFRQIFKPQLEKVVSIAASRGRKSLNVKWREPYGAILASLAMDQSHMMYVAEISPPTENDEFLKMMPACDEIACVYSPDTELPEGDNNNNFNIQGRQSRNSVTSNSDASIISYSTVTSSVSTSSTGSTVSNPDTDITVVESLHSSKERKKERQRVLYNDDLDPHRMNNSNSPYHAIFRNLRLDIDYKITISFLLSGHCIGLVDFTVMAEKRKISFDLPGERKDSNISSVSTDTSLSSMLGSQIDPVEDHDQDLMKEIADKAELDQYIAGFGKDDVSVLVIGAQWCQICVRMRPALERLASEQPTVKFLYVDFSQVPSIKEDFSIAAFPTLFILRGENVMEKIIGDQTQILTKKLKFYTSFRKMSTESTCSQDSCSAVIPPESRA